MRFLVFMLLAPAAMAVTFFDDATISDGFVMTERLRAFGSLTANGTIDGPHDIDVSGNFTARGDIGADQPVSSIDAFSDMHFSGDSINATGSIDISNRMTFGAGSFSGIASDWDFFGPVTFEQAGTFTISATAGDIDFSGAINGPSSGTVTIRTYTPNGEVDVSSSAPSNVQFVTLSEPPDATDPEPEPSTATSPLSNISTRAVVAPGGVIQPGFVVAGDISRRVLVRAVGPTLANFGVSNAMPDPTLEILQNGSRVTFNDDWSTDDAGTFQQVGAFALGDGLADAAAVVTLSPGVYNVIVKNKDDATGGDVLLEVYFVE